MKNNIKCFYKTFSFIKNIFTRFFIKKITKEYQIFFSSKYHDFTKFYAFTTHIYICIYLFVDKAHFSNFDVFFITRNIAAFIYNKRSSPRNTQKSTKKLR